MRSREKTLTSLFAVAEDVACFQMYFPKETVNQNGQVIRDQSCKKPALYTTQSTSCSMLITGQLMDEVLSIFCKIYVLQ